MSLAHRLFEIIQLYLCRQKRADVEGAPLPGSLPPPCRNVASSHICLTTDVFRVQRLASSQSVHFGVLEATP